MPQPTLSQVHVDVPLTNLGIAYMQGPTNHFGRRIFAPVPVTKQAGKYFIYDKAAWFRDEAQPRAPGTRAHRSGFTMSTGSYTCEENAVAHPMPDEVRKNYDGPIAADRAAAGFVGEKILIREDRLFASKYLATGLWGKDITGVAAAPGANQVFQWSDVTNSDPIADIRTYKRYVQKQIGREPNFLALGPDVTDALVNHPDIIDRLPTTGMRVTNLLKLAEIFDLPAGSVISMDSVYNSAKEGQTAVMAHAVGKVALLGYRSPSPAIDEPSCGYVFHWSEFDTRSGGSIDGLAAAGAPTIRQYREEPEKQDVYEGNCYFDMKITATDAAVFFTSIVA